MSNLFRIESKMLFFLFFTLVFYPFIFMIVVSVSFIFVMRCNVKVNKGFINGVLFFLIIPYVIYCMINISIISDAERYIEFYLNATSFVSDSFNIEIGYPILVSLLKIIEPNSVNFYKLSIVLFFLLLLSIQLKSIGDIKWYIISFFIITPNVFVGPLFTTRQFLSYNILIIAILCFKYRSNIASIALLVISFFFHTSAVIFFPILFNSFRRFILNKRIYIFLLFFCLFIPVDSILNYIGTIFPEGSNIGIKLLYYKVTEVGSVSYFSPMFFFPLYLVVYFLMFFDKNDVSKVKQYLISFFLYVFVIQAITINNDILFTRAGYYNVVFIYFTAAIFMEHSIKYSKVAFYYMSGFFILYMLQFIRWSYKNDILQNEITIANGDIISGWISLFNFWS